MNWEKKYFDTDRKGDLKKANERNGHNHSARGAVHA